MSTTLTNLELLAFSGERKRSDGKLHADISIRVDHKATNPHLMQGLGERLLASGHALKFGDRSYSVENFLTDDNNTIRLFLSREDDLTILQRERAQEVALWVSMEKIFTGKGA